MEAASVLRLDPETGTGSLPTVCCHPKGGDTNASLSRVERVRGFWVICDPPQLGKRVLADAVSCGCV